MEILRLLWLSPAGVTVIERRDGALVEPCHFPAGERAALAHHLAATPRGRWRLVVERGEEECRLERLPRLRGGDRRRLLAATAERLFPDTPYRHRERIDVAEGEERWGFSALNDPHPLAELTELAGGPPEVVTTPTRLLPLLLQRLGETAGERLVAWRTWGGGLRLVLLRGGRPVATRLAPAEAALDDELAATRAYLERLGVWPQRAAEPLRLDGAVDRAENAVEGRPFADPLFALLALESPRPPGYGRSRPARLPALPAFIALSLLAAAGGLGAAALEAQRQASQLERALAHTSPAATVEEVAARRRVAAVERAEALRPHALRAAPLLGRLGRVLEAFPSLAVERLAWRAGAEGEALLLELAGRLPAGDAGEAVQALAQRLRNERGVMAVTVTRPPPPVEGFGDGEATLPFALRLELRGEDDWR
ncbi:hypothetical protein [Endothiovibrio diazotrophicus]